MITCLRLIMFVNVTAIYLFFCPLSYAREDTPNIILLTADACRPGNMSCYGYVRKTTPNIDRLAKDGVLFTNAFSQSAWTTPGLISIFTSLYPFTHNVEARGDSLNDNVLALPEILKKNGYAVPVYQWLINIPNYQNLGFDVLDKEKFCFSRDEELVKLIEAYKERKFFIWYHYKSTHLPYNPVPPYDTMFQGEVVKSEIEESSGLALVKKKSVVKYGTVEFKDGDRDKILSLYDGEIKRFDDYVGRLLEKLETSGLLNNTILIITSDHGEELLEHGFVGHASTSLNAKLYDELIRIPLIIWYPEKFKQKKIESYVQQIDIMPTLMDVIGLQIPDNFQGHSLLPQIRGELEKFSSPVYCQTNKGGYQSTEEMKKIKLRCIRTKEWKLISTTSPEEVIYELYNLINDPDEKVNVVKQYPLIANGLKKKLQEIAVK